MRKTPNTEHETTTTGMAFVVVRDGRITIGPEGTPQLYCHKYKAAQLANALERHIGKCKVRKARYTITLGAMNFTSGGMDPAVPAREMEASVAAGAPQCPSPGVSLDAGCMFQDALDERETFERLEILFLLHGRKLAREQMRLDDFCYGDSRGWVEWDGQCFVPAGALKEAIG